MPQCPCPTCVSCADGSFLPAAEYGAVTVYLVISARLDFGGGNFSRRYAPCPNMSAWLQEAASGEAQSGRATPAGRGVFP